MAASITDVVHDMLQRPPNEQARFIQEDYSCTLNSCLESMDQHDGVVEADPGNGILKKPGTIKDEPGKKVKFAMNLVSYKIIESIYDSEAEPFNPNHHREPPTDNYGTSAVEEIPGDMTTHTADTVKVLEGTQGTSAVEDIRGDRKKRSADTLKGPEGSQGTSEVKDIRGDIKKRTAITTKVSDVIQMTPAVNEYSATTKKFSNEVERGKSLELDWRHRSKDSIRNNPRVKSTGKKKIYAVTPEIQSSTEAEPMSQEKKVKLPSYLSCKWLPCLLVGKF